LREVRADGIFIFYSFEKQITTIHRFRNYAKQQFFPHIFAGNFLNQKMLDSIS